MVRSIQSEETKTDPVIVATLSIIDELTVLLSNEIQLLKQQDVSGIQALLRHKGRLVMNYNTNMKSIIAQPNLLQQSSQEMRNRLKEAGTKLAKATELNAAALRAAAMATQNLIQTIVGLARDEVLPKNSYADPRTAHMMLGAYSPMCPPVAINHTA